MSYKYKYLNTCRFKITKMIVTKVYVWDETGHQTQVHVGFRFPGKNLGLYNVSDQVSGSFDANYCRITERIIAYHGTGNALWFSSS